MILCIRIVLIVYLMFDIVRILNDDSIRARKEDNDPFLFWDKRNALFYIASILLALTF